MMRPRSTSRRSLAALLLLACLPGAALLAADRIDPGLLVLRLSRDTAAQGAPAQESVTAPGQPAAVQMPPSSRFAVIALRPLFAPDRRPPDAPAAATEAPTDPTAPDMLVTGIVMAGEDSVAIIEPARPGPNAESMVARIGHSIAGWKVEAIKPDRVILSRDGKQHEMMLIKEDDPRRARPVRRITPPVNRRVAPVPPAPKQPTLPRQPVLPPQPQTQ